MAHAASASSYTSIGTSILEEREGEDRFKNLTDLKWGEFESLGFGGLGETKLQFDLTESARTVSFNAPSDLLHSVMLVCTYRRVP